MEKINIVGIDEVIYKHVCASGLEVYIWPYELSNEINFSLAVKYGSFHTKFKINDKEVSVPNGIAHFLEHVKFNEEDGKTANDFYSKIGSYANAYTTYEYTSYEVTCQKDIEENLNHLLYYVYNPYFTKELVAKEKGIIIEEAKGALNNAYSKGYHKLLENLYTYNPRRNLITGTPDEVASITLEDVKLVYENFYVPENMFLIVTGNVDPNKIVAIADKFFEGKKFNKFAAAVIMPNEPLKIENQVDTISAEANKNKMFLAYKFDRTKFKCTDIELKICINRLCRANFGTISEFYEYVTTNNIVDEITCNNIIDKNNVAIIFESAGDDLNLIKDLIDDKMNHLSIDEETFNRIKKGSIASLILGYDDPSYVGYQIGRDLIDFGRVVNDLKDIQSDLTIDIMNNILKNINNENKTYVIINPKN